MMAARWRTLNSEAGILRKKQPENPEDLLVFGYSCKLFRDDEKALYIDQGKHLISWMGDDKLKIDRYDGRGALSELSSCEASREGYDAMRWLGLSDSERRIEQLCDEERYYSLYANEEEEELYKEEEQKRLQQKSNEFQYSYEGGEKSGGNTEEGPQLNEQVSSVEEKPFTPPIELDVPADIAIPKTIKENARIEKTALFVYRQGGQMEILIKAKQSDNPQFGFLNQDNSLYKYYRHVLSAIKSGRYKVEEVDTDEKKEEQTDHETNEDTYLHPSLLATSTTPIIQTAVAAAAAAPPPPLPPLPYKPSADCAYSQLVNRIQGAQQKQEEINNGGDSTTTTTQTNYEQQYYQYYYAQQQYYEYYKQQYQAQNQSGDFQAYMSNCMKEQNIDAKNNYLTFYTQQQQQQASSNPYAQIVTHVNNVTPPETLVPTKTTTTTTVIITEKKPSVLSLVQNYGSESEASTSEDNEEEQEENNTKEEKRVVIRQPPTETRLVIDKMASYVAKNGADFEAIVKSKGDPRFEFLSETHEFYAYYKTKIREFGGGENNETEVAVKSTVNKPKKVITPVSFSIKKSKDDAPKEIKSALPVEESSDEDEGGEKMVETPSTTPPPPPEQEKPSTDVAIETKKNGLLDEDDPILEMIDLTEDIEDRRDVKRAEDKIKDKLAAAAREKLAAVGRDKTLQLERRKRAAAFLKLHTEEREKRERKVEETVVLRDESRTSPPPSSSSSKKKHRREREERENASDAEEGEIRKRKSKKKKAHKRKRSGSRKKSKKRRRESSCSS